MKGFDGIDSFLNETYEYVFVSVPAEKRKPEYSLIFILTGFAFSFSGVVVGAEIGRSMPFYQALFTCLTGNLVLFAAALFWGNVGCDSGYTGVFWVRKTFGDKMAAVFSALIVLAMIIWVGINGDLLAKLIISVFSGWPIPLPVTALLVIVLGIYCSRRGWRSLEIISRLACPVIIFLTIYNVIHIGEMKEGFSFLLHYQPESVLPFSTAVTMLVGNFTLSVATIPDICRFAGSRRVVFRCAAFYALILTVNNLCGILVIQATGANNMNYGIYLLEMIIPAFIWGVLCLYTTQNVNMYTGSLAIQNLVMETTMGGNISHKTAVLFIGGLSIMVGSIGAVRYLEEFTGILVLFITPVTGIAAAERLTGKGLKKVKESIPLVSWAAGTLAGCVFWYIKGKGTWLLPMAAAGIVYGALRKRQPMEK